MDVYIRILVKLTTIKLKDIYSEGMYRYSYIDTCTGISGQVMPWGELSMKWALTGFKIVYSIHPLNTAMPPR